MVSKSTSSNGSPFNQELISEVVSTIIPIAGEPKTYVYPNDASSEFIIRDSTKSTGVDLPLECIEVISETLEVSKGLRNGGIDFKANFSIPVIGGSVGIEVKRQPRVTTKKITKAIYRPKK